MTDKELLEFAAKAAGVNLDYRRTSGSFYYDDSETGREMWQPLDDDRQSFILMVDLCLDVLTKWGNDVSVITLNGNEFREQHGTDKHAATRRAIVRAAAAIGAEL